MCRLTAYLGQPIALGQMLLGAPHSLVRDAYSFGVGWYAPDAVPAVYINTSPSWLDNNLPHLGRSLSSGLWLAHTQNIGPALPSAAPTSQPLYDDEFLFIQHGGIAQFRTTLAPLIRSFLAPELEAGLQTNSEAEYLFAIVRHLLADDDEMSIDQALSEMFELLENWLDGLPAQLNMIITDGEGVYAVRHGINAACAPLYYTTDAEDYPGAQLIVSEPLSSSEFWQPVPEHHILILDSYEPPDVIPLH
ncbi:MAG TPA: class II glutamine amidotransferase [Gammaproteobacteria bacterium]|nr:class II glutamine amidotransferase [Gammaproteobacteria bacterium]